MISIRVSQQQEGKNLMHFSTLAVIKRSDEMKPCLLSGWQYRNLQQDTAR
jgi:hypothetical protein